MGMRKMTRVASCLVRWAELPLPRKVRVMGNSLPFSSGGTQSMPQAPKINEKSLISVGKTV